MSVFSTNTIYVKITINKLSVRHIESGKERVAFAKRPFTTHRLLIGNFSVADKMLRNMVKQVRDNGLFALKPVVVMHPLEMVEGGLSEIEDRVMRELAAGAAGARKTLVWLGKELGDKELLQNIDEAV